MPRNHRDDKVLERVLYKTSYILNDLGQYAETRQIDRWWEENQFGCLNANSV